MRLLSIVSRPPCAAWLAALVVAAPPTFAATPAAPAPTASAPAAPLTIHFESKVANLEVAASEMRTAARKTTRVPLDAGPLYYGAIARRLPGDSPRASIHYVLFAAKFENGVATEAWCDANGDDDMTNDPPLTLNGYPGEPSSRAFLVDLHWKADAGWRPVQVDRKVRVVLAPPTEPGENPIARVQYVYAMVGRVPVDGVERTAVLFDGNGDGIYSTAFGDGLFVDGDGDGHFVIDQMDPNFVAFEGGAQLGGTSYNVVNVDPTGTSLTLAATGAAEPVRSARVGEAVPDFSYRDAEGHEGRLRDFRGAPVALYVFASWCGACASQAPDLTALYERRRAAGFRILGVSYDTDEAAMKSFRTKHSETWPTTFSGRMLWEDPIGKRLRADTVGMLYLVDREGRLAAVCGSPSELDTQLDALAGSDRTSQR